MQRRAAALYFTFFLAAAVGAWAYIGVAEDVHQPEFSVSGTSFGADSTASIGGVEYTVGELGRAGGEGAGALEATLTWTNRSAVQTATLDHNATATVRDGEYTVLVPNGTDDPTSFTLREQLNVSALLAADPSVENDLAEQNGTRYVVDVENQTLRPLSEWLPPRETLQFAEGDALAHQNRTATVASVAAGSVTLRWEAPADREETLTEGSNVTLAGGGQYFAHFRSENEVVLAPVSEYSSYGQTVAERDYFRERIAGLWGVVIVSGGAALFLLSVAYLPTRG